jgi:hypothetical protein
LFRGCDGVCGIAIAGKPTPTGYVSDVNPCGSGLARDEALTFTAVSTVVLVSMSCGLIMPAFANISRLSPLGKYR